MYCEKMRLLHCRFNVHGGRHTLQDLHRSERRGVRIVAVCIPLRLDSLHMGIGNLMFCVNNNTDFCDFKRQFRHASMYSSQANDNPRNRRRGLTWLAPRILGT